MNESVIIDIFRKAVLTVITVAGPILGIAIFVGLIVAIFQATTQINEQTMAFVPKIIAILLGIVFFGPWILSKMTEFAIELFENILTII